MKVCVEFYDDPELAGTIFGPETVATDDQGGTSTIPEARRHSLTGTGEWIRRAWTLSSVSLAGVDTDESTGGPRFISSGGAVAVSRVEFGIFRVGVTRSLYSIPFQIVLRIHRSAPTPMGITLSGTWLPRRNLESDREAHNPIKK
jgi:hypothetical protein